jgi:ABC-type branched-subunit amino acid transport system ATPase component/ABC-type branched-subunit amino acid transport system permease subunit
LVIALALFIQFSSLGKQIRAAANNSDAARLCGISVRKVSALTWALAGLLAAVSAVLQAPGQATFGLSALGPYLLLLTLGAAAFGAFVSLPAALGGGLVIGLVSEAVADLTNKAEDAELAVFVLIMVVVFVRGRAISRVFTVAGGAADDLPLTRVPPSLRRSPLVRHQRLGLALGALFLGLIWPQLPYFSSAGNRFLLTEILLFAAVGVALTMLLGWGGQVSLGHFAVVGLGAYLAARWANHGWNLPELCLVAGAVCAVVTVLVGLPALRVRGLTLAVTTLGFAIVADDWLFRQSWIGTTSPSGLSTPPIPLARHLGTPSSPGAIYYVALVVLTLIVLAAGALRRSNPGRLMLAVRDNERASAAFGVSPATVKLALLAVSGFAAGTVGVVWADAWQTASTEQFPADLSIALIAIPVIGGLGSVGGAVAAAAFLFGGTYFIGPHVQWIFGSFGHSLAFALVLAGAGQVFVLLKMPTGLAGGAQRFWETYLAKRAHRAQQLRAAGDPGLPLVVRDVSVHFGGVVAVDSASVEVRAGEIVGLIGTNGAGKTTLMNVISGVTRPQHGSVQVFGNDVTDLPPDFRTAFGLSRSFQDATLFGGLTVTETIQVALAYRNKVGVVSAMLAAPWARQNERRTRRAADEVINRFGLRAWADTRTSELSTGTRRICDLAAQVAAQPKLVLLDEPTAGVAQREAEAFGPLLRQIRDELDCAILIVEHDMPLLMGLCDRVYALEAGHVITEGTPEDVRNDPRVVASYLGTEQVAIARSGGRAPARSRTQTRRSGNGAKATTNRRASTRSTKAAQNGDSSRDNGDRTRPASPARRS